MSIFKKWGGHSIIGFHLGFDKNAEAYNALFKMGFAFVEVGTIVPLAQPGNLKPRVFRLYEDFAVINRYGFNSQGIDQILPRVATHERSQVII